MIGRQKRVLLRHYLEQGMNKAGIARDLGVSRRTVYHWIETGQLDRELDEERVGYGPRCLMPSKLDPYKPLIDTRLKEYPKLTAVRLFKEVRAAGYPGSYNQVKRYVRKVRPRPPEEPVVRFETAPGRQGQVDFAHFRLPWGKRYALIVVLGYSRLLWVQFYTRQTMKALMHGLESSFSYFGGVPRELLFDPMKAVVIEDGRYDDGALVENPEFMRYAYHWNFRIRACRPYRAQTKGKVERRPDRMSRLGHVNPQNGHNSVTNNRVDYGLAPDSCSYQELDTTNYVTGARRRNPCGVFGAHLRFWIRASCAAPLRLARSRSP